MSKRYKFKHCKNVYASIAYDWSIKALILDKDNVVICSVPRQNIEKSKSWKLIKNK